MTGWRADGPGRGGLYDQAPWTGVVLMDGSKNPGDDRAAALRLLMARLVSPDLTLAEAVDLRLQVQALLASAQAAPPSSPAPTMPPSGPSGSSLRAAC